jgi:uncharacterized protein (TIGR03000 family)
VRVEFRLGEGGAPAAAEASAPIDLKVPEGAEVWFNGEKTTQTGSLRRFETPPLSPNTKCCYEVRVTWKTGGTAVSETRQLSFAAGESVRATFPAATASSETGPPNAPALAPEAGK